MASLISYRANEKINLLKKTSGERIILRPMQASGFQNHAIKHSYFLWGYMKSLGYADKPESTEASEKNIRRGIVDIQQQALQKVFGN